MIKKENVEKRLKELEQELKDSPNSVGLNFARKKTLQMLEEFNNNEKLDKYFNK